MKIVSLILAQALVLCAISVSKAQDSQALDAVEQDVFFDKTHDPNRLAAYYVELGLDEQKQLDLLARKGEISESELLRKLILDEALRPINDLLESDSFTQDAMEKLMFDMDRFKAISTALGDEAVRLVSERVSKSVRSLKASPRVDAEGPVHLLRHPAIYRQLLLTDDQEDDIRILESSFREKMRFNDDSDAAEMDRLLQQHWKNLLGTLNDSQRDLATDLVGSPVSWFRCVGVNKLRNSESSSGGEVILPGNFAGSTTPDGRSILQLNPQELEKRGIIPLHSHICEMLKNPFCWDELEMTNQQRKSCREFDLAKVLALPDYAGNRIRALVAGDAELPEQVNELVTPHQQELFRQMEVQILGGKYESSVCLLMPEVIEKLSITLSQKRQIESMSRSFVLKMDPLERKLKGKRIIILEEFRNEILKILTEEQRLVFKRVAPNPSSN